jgi:dTDP-4-amino-4,6-dideoxygalactose transaminase
MQIPLVDLRAQFLSLQPEVEAAMTEVFARCDFVLGESVAQFEANFAAYCGVPHAIGVDSGVSALELVLRAWGIGPGDEVITAANSFIASASAISFTGAHPVLVDVDPRTYLMTPEAVERAITPRTQVIMPVHLYGQPVDMDPILALAKVHGLRVLEDACQAHGARCRGARVGSLGDAAAFSFHPEKNLGAYGDGGAVVTADPALAAALRVLRNYGQREKDHHVSPAYNRRLDTLQAAVLDVKLRHLDAANTARARAARLYRALLADLPVDLPYPSEWAEHVYHLFVVQVNDRDAVLERLKEAGVGAGIHYPIPIHLQSTYAYLGYGRGSFPVTERVAERVLSLPLYPELREEQIEHVVASLRSAVLGAR